MRQIFRKFLRNAGFSRRIAPDFNDVMKANSIDLVLDVGANDGSYGREIRDRGYEGAIISFEPNPAAYARLKSKIRNDFYWEAYPFALGEKEEELDLAIAENDVMSSFKPLTEFGKEAVRSQVGRTKCRILTLDRFLADNPHPQKNIYLKIDTQGYELEVLRGASESLQTITAVQAETSLIHTYANEADWIDFLLWMRERNFEVATAVCNSACGWRIRELDIVFTHPPRDQLLYLKSL